VPLSANRHGSMVVLEGNSAQHLVTNAHVSANYFEMLSIPIVRGRTFEEREMRADSYVVIVSEKKARRFWPGEDPVGMHFRFGEDKAYSEVVGVAKDIHASSLSKADDTLVYLPVTPKDHIGLSVLVRGKAGFAAIGSAIATETRALDANVLAKAVRFEDNLEIWKIGSRITSSLALVLGLVGLLLASVGIYRRYGVRGDAADEGNRDPHDAGRATEGRAAPGSGAIDAAGGDWRGAGHWPVVRRYSSVLSSLFVRRQPAGSAGVRRACRVSWRRWRCWRGGRPRNGPTRVDPMSALRHE